MATEEGRWIEGSEHLGGYWPGGDPAGVYEVLWAACVDLYGAESIIDVGAGEGIAADFWRKLGCVVEEVDGLPVRESTVVHDFTTGPYIPRNHFDIAWSCEFVEHVDPVYVFNFIETFKAADLTLMTHATPGQQGYHHVNCRTASYWIGLMRYSGFKYDPVLTGALRKLAAENPHPDNYFAKTGLAFWYRGRR